MSNIFKIKRGSKAPTSANLSGYELGYYANGIYIYDESAKTVVKLNKLSTVLGTTSDVVPLSMGGVGVLNGASSLIDAPDNALIRKGAGVNYLYYTATSEGAYYATGDNARAQFGTLPLRYGGTGNGSGLPNAPEGAVIVARTEGTNSYLGYTSVLGLDHGGLGNTQGRPQTEEITPPEDTTYYRLAFHGGGTGAAYLRNTETIRVAARIGTKSVSGRAALYLGNSIKAGVAGNARGAIVLYSDGGGFAYIYPHADNTEETDIRLPAAGGTLARLTDTVSGAEQSDKIYVQENNTTGTTYRIPHFYTSSNYTGYFNLRDTGDFTVYRNEPTSGTGYIRLELGNDVVKTINVNENVYRSPSYGVLRLYGTNEFYINLRTSITLTDNRTIYLPDTGGTIALTSSNVSSASTVATQETNTTGTTYRIAIHTVTSGNASLRNSEGFRMYKVNGTESTEGVDRLTLGTNFPPTVLGNSYGQLRLYTRVNTNLRERQYVTISSVNTDPSQSGTYTLYLPTYTGNSTEKIATLNDFKSDVIESGLGQVILVLSSNNYYFRPDETYSMGASYYLGSSSHPWQRVYTNAITIYTSRITCKPTYDNTVGSASNLYVNSDGLISRTTNTSSRLNKKDIKTIELDELNPENLLKINVYQFKYRDNIITDKKDPRYNANLIGFMIDEVYKYFPVAVDKQNEDETTWSWNPQYIIPPMLKLIQDQHKKIKSLKDRLDKIETKLKVWEETK